MWWEELVCEYDTTKNFMKKPSPRMMRDLLNEDSKIPRTIAGLIAGHCRLVKHMQRPSIELAKSKLSRFSQEEGKSAKLELCHYKSLKRLRFLLQGEEKPSTESYLKAPPTKLRIRQIGLEEVP